MNRTPRLVAAATASTLTLALALTGCGRSDEAGTTDEGSTGITDGPATGTIEVWAMGTEGELLPELAEQFEADNPEATVNVTPVPWESSTEKINTAIATGEVPDVMQVGTTLMSGFVGLDGLAPTPEAIDPDAFFPGAWDTTVVDGTSYGVPWYVESRVLYYRTDLAQEAGVEAPQTWADLTEFAAGLQDAGADEGIALQTRGNSTALMYLPFYWQAGGEIMDDAGEFTLDNDAQVKALEYYSSFMRDGLAPPVLVEDEKVQNFVDGRLGSFVSGPWERANLLTTAGDDFAGKFGVVPLPSDETTASFIGGSNLAVLADAANPDAAWKFVQFATDPATQVDWFGISSDLPAVEASWEDPALADDDAVAVYEDVLTTARSTPAIPTWAEIEHELDLIIEQVIAGDLTPQDAATQMQDAATSIGTGLD
ncbi:extracellular solute-binding protein [Promicromonospora thailandica]|uniref:Carbohydrate ABC transporter substrate-binding protein, CUT1 family (TC 3.A.1.1.-) n=1 Tax=Promicromonospora thailandica TaxID=765201 RepID=A0A9X2G2W8_9MICO|nr:extracellular solute-binding protein [Promicromonospora thailandica]MCP2265904.1 carbohydrate ABC transporter substrate-binding protein, CUT1 family (TC 3.A.1.1.-) [Promicromonospora thailandica]BFF21526.1 extracellular solute-binding protein [Promicromonospora thailandica]